MLFACLLFVCHFVCWCLCLCLCQCLSLCLCQWMCLCQCLYLCLCRVLWLGCAIGPRCLLRQHCGSNIAAAAALQQQPHCSSSAATPAALQQQHCSSSSAAAPAALLQQQQQHCSSSSTAAAALQQQQQQCNSSTAALQQLHCGIVAATPLQQQQQQQHCMLGFDLRRFGSHAVSSHTGRYRHMRSNRSMSAPPWCLKIRVWFLQGVVLEHRCLDPISNLDRIPKSKISPWGPRGPLGGACPTHSSIPYTKSALPRARK